MYHGGMVTCPVCRHHYCTEYGRQNVYEWWLYGIIWVLIRSGSGGGRTPRSPAHKEMTYGRNKCTASSRLRKVRAATLCELFPAARLRGWDRRQAADSYSALWGAD